MPVSNKTWREPLLVVLCGFQALLAVVAALAAYEEVESILGTCPAMAVLGFVLAFFAVRRASLSLLAFSLWCPLATSSIALLIASLDWSPGKAARPVFVLLTLNAVITLAWGVLTAVRLNKPSPPGQSPERPRIRFRIMGLLRIMALLAVLLTLLKYLSYSTEYVIFWLFGFGTLTISLAIGVWFFYRTRAG